MAQVINTPPAQTSEGSGMGTGLVLGIIVVVLVVLALLFFGLPRLGGGGEGAPASNFGAEAPEGGAPVGGGQQQGIDVDVPEEVDIDVNQP